MAPEAQSAQAHACSFDDAEAAATAGEEPAAALGAAVTVRPVREDDKPRWLQLFRDYIAWYQAALPDDDIQVSDDIIQLTWQRLMQGGEAAHQGLVAAAPDGEVVGLAHVLMHRSTWHETPYCYLEDLYVDQQVRARGVGRALIHAVYKLADSHGAAKTYWQTHSTNHKAQALYNKMAKQSEFIMYVRPQ